MNEPITKRCNAEQRKAFNRRAPYQRACFGAQPGEPALGTLEQRLAIIIRRLGGKR